jgi:hypothetical protein
MWDLIWKVKNEVTATFSEILEKGFRDYLVTV